MPGDKTVMLGFSHETPRAAGVLEVTEKELEKPCPENGVTAGEGSQPTPYAEHRDSSASRVPEAGSWLRSRPPALTVMRARVVSLLPCRGSSRPVRSCPHPPPAERANSCRTRTQLLPGPVPITYPRQAFKYTPTPVRSPPNCPPACTLTLANHGGAPQTPG